MPMNTNPFPAPATRSKSGLLQYLFGKHQISHLVSQIPIEPSYSAFIEKRISRSLISDSQVGHLDHKKKKATEQEGTLFLYNRSDHPVWRCESAHPMFQALTAFKEISNADASVVVIDRLSGVDRPDTSSIASWLVKNYPKHQVGTHMDMMICAPKSSQILRNKPSQKEVDFEPEIYCQMPAGQTLMSSEFFDERSAIQEGYSRSQCISSVAITNNGSSFDNLKALCGGIDYARRHHLPRVYTQAIPLLPIGEHYLNDGLTIVNRSNSVYNDEEVILAGPYDSWQPAADFNTSPWLEIAGELLPLLNRRIRKDDPLSDLCIHLGPAPADAEHREPNARTDRADLGFYRRIFGLRSWGFVSFVSRSKNHRAIQEIEAEILDLRFSVPRIASESEEIDHLLHARSLVLCSFNLAPALTAIQLSKSLRTIIIERDLFIGPIPQHIQILRI